MHRWHDQWSCNSLNSNTSVVESKALRANSWILWSLYAKTEILCLDLPNPFQLSHFFSPWKYCTTCLPCIFRSRHLLCGLENDDYPCGTGNLSAAQLYSARQFHTSQFSTFCEPFLPCLHVTNPFQPLIASLEKNNHPLFHLQFK